MTRREQILGIWVCIRANIHPDCPLWSSSRLIDFTAFKLSEAIATSHLSTIDGSQGRVRHVKTPMHENGLLPYSPGLHHKYNATQSAQAAAHSHCPWNPNRGPLQTFSWAGPLMSVGKDRTMANPRYATRKLHRQSLEGVIMLPSNKAIIACYNRCSHRLLACHTLTVSQGSYKMCYLFAVFTSPLNL